MRPDLKPTDLNGAAAWLIEECSEVVKPLAKAFRFGPKPTDPRTGIAYDNILDAMRELLDLDEAIFLFRYFYRAKREEPGLRLRATAEERAALGSVRLARDGDATYAMVPADLMTRLLADYEDLVREVPGVVEGAAA